MKGSAAIAAGLLAVSIGGVVATGCGDDDDGDEAAQSATAGTAVEIKMDDFKFVPRALNQAAGEVKITAPNVGKVEHELELFKTDDDPASFTVVEGKVDTEALEEAGAEEVGELEAEPGETGEGSFTLEPGKYAMICNVSGHYEQGMYGSITVK